VLNFSYAEMFDFPMISETTTLYCAAPWQNVTYNWAGVPLFYLLGLAKVIPGGYREVIFNATDNFSQSLPLEVIMEPTSILALKANGTDLQQLTGFGSGYQVVFPCRWGYKWVRYVQYITVVDYVYRGADLALTSPRVNCTMPATDPPTTLFNATEDNTEYSVLVLTNSTANSMSYHWETQMVLNLTGTEGDFCYFYAAFSKELLNGPYAVHANQKSIDHSEIYACDKAYVFLAFALPADIVLVEINQLITIGHSSAWGVSVRPVESDI